VRIRLAFIALPFCGQTRLSQLTISLAGALGDTTPVLAPRSDWLVDARLAGGAWHARLTRAARDRVSALSDSVSRRPPSLTRRCASDDGAIHSSSTGRHIMLRWALIFALVAIVAGLLGFTGIAAGAAVVAKTIFYIFLGLVVVFILLGVTVAKKL
jgi:uncharacterized membrane protein YtjA (UPF0391 family)